MQAKQPKITSDIDQINQSKARLIIHESSHQTLNGCLQSLTKPRFGFKC